MTLSPRDAHALMVMAFNKGNLLVAGALAARLQTWLSSPEAGRNTFSVKERVILLEIESRCTRTHEGNADAQAQ